MTPPQSPALLEQCPNDQCYQHLIQVPHPNLGQFHRDRLVLGGIGSNIVAKVKQKGEVEDKLVVEDPVEETHEQVPGAGRGGPGGRNHSKEAKSDLAWMKSEIVGS